MSREHPENPVTPVILAAGESSRMGRAKALLDFGGLTGIGRILATCRKAGLSRPIAVVGHDPEPIRAELAGTEAAVVENADWKRGQTSSIQRGLRALPAGAEAFLLWPVDLPLVAETTVRALLGVWKKRNPFKKIWLPVFEGHRAHPALFDLALAGEFQALGPDSPAHQVVRKDPSRVREVPVSDPYVGAPLNTPQEYERLLAQFAKRADRI